ncbi:DUF2497 domain-containing protein [Rickettsiales endosymbiont of Stachyamoeba lipophora]|uniref:DUF2497 domain-containing protein n=1 Tax=Rickettsiales endosymbiont of Stachyamoeba lipophora TaxID=2486578 RepID=UPI000F655205|nr:DUF2497 domain-containing protein [Rickettsiales endosymbiont of Stachyamoeba lipophora]AZL15713.1 DUF2497 domain-containing protein [Rickettsiales endosymbiont of Stachyamoeba lipophora]
MSDNKEPSMNEILENIRDVIDGESKPAIQADEDVLVLDKEVVSEVSLAGTTENNTLNDKTDNNIIIAVEPKQHPAILAEDSAKENLNSNDYKSKEAPITEKEEKDILADIDKMLGTGSKELIEGDHKQAVMIQSPPPVESTQAMQEPVFAEQAKQIDQKQGDGSQPAVAQISVAAKNNDTESVKPTAPIQKSAIAPVNKPLADQVGENSHQEEGLISEAAFAESTQAIQSLMNKVHKSSINDIPLKSGSTLEDLVKEAMKPMLKEWLDQNLPAIVKSIVEKEIKKIIP